MTSGSTCSSQPIETCSRFLGDIKQNNTMADLMDEAIEISHKLIPCNICGRTFLPSPLKKHAKVCEKNATRKRKTFNSLKQRLEGTELAVFHQKCLRRSDSLQTSSIVANTNANAGAGVGVGGHVSAPGTVSANASHLHLVNEKKNQSKWKEKHEELVQAIRAAKGENIMAPRRSISAVGNMGTTEQCPSCDRHFGPKAYDRHVEWCKEHKIRASHSPAIVTIAKERLEARTKYRVPPLNKSKRSVTREKYAFPSSRNNPEAVLNVRSTSSLEQTSGVNMDRRASGTRKLKKHVAAAATNNQNEPVIKHNSEKLKSSNFKYRVYPLLKMNDTNINESVLDMTVSQMNLLCSPSRLTTSTTINPSLFTCKIWTDTQPHKQFNANNNNNDENEKNKENVSKNNCLPFTVNLVDSETKLQINNDQMNHIEYQETQVYKDNQQTLNEDDTNFLNYLPTIQEEDTIESPKLITIKEPSSIMEIHCESDLDEPELEELEDLKEECFESSTPIKNPDSPIQIRNETETSISFDISPILKPAIYETPDNISAQRTIDEISEQEWQDLDEYYDESWKQRKKEKKRDVFYFDDKYEIKQKTRKDAKILDRFLKEKRNNCRLEVEIIANESQKQASNKKEKNNFKLYRVSSSEIIIRGDKCIDALNKSFSRNKIKHVNIVFVNEETKDETEIVLKSDLNAKKYKNSFIINNNSLKTKLSGQCSKDQHHRDNFWDQYTQNDYEITTDVDDYNEGNLTLPPINVKIKNLKKKFRCHSPSPTRFPPIHDEKNHSYDPFIIAEKQLMELLQDDTPPKISNKTPSPKQKKFRDNFELIENLINDNFIDPKLINEIDDLKIPDELTIFDYSPPIAYNNDVDVDLYSAQYDKNISILEPLVLPKTESKHLLEIEFDEFLNNNEHFLQNKSPKQKTKIKSNSTNFSFGNKTSKTIKNEKKHPLTPLKRSISLSNPVVKARSMKNKQDIQDYLHVRERKPSRGGDKTLSPRSSDDLFPAGHDMYNEYKKYEEIYRREQDNDEQQHENENDSSNEEEEEEEDITPPPQPIHNYNHSHSHSNAKGDSAYGSLNRKSPKPKVQPGQQLTVNARQGKTAVQKISPSSSASGSDTCASVVRPPAVVNKKNMRLTKFCHECGTKYPLDCAKFCVECGIKRLVL